jgi:hypothetical protein
LTLGVIGKPNGTRFALLAMFLAGCSHAGGAKRRSPLQLVTQPTCIRFATLRSKCGVTTVRKRDAVEPAGGIDGRRRGLVRAGKMKPGDGARLMAAGAAHLVESCADVVRRLHEAERHARGTRFLECGCDLADPAAAFVTQVREPGERVLEGFDVVSFYAETSPECSPLSCNSLASKSPSISIVSSRQRAKRES